MSTSTGLGFLVALLVLRGLHGAFAVADTAGAPSAPPPRAAALYVPGQLVVKLRPEARIGDLASLNARLRADSAEDLFPAGGPRAVYRLKVPADTDIWHVALEYSRHPAVAYAEPNLRVRLAAPPNDPLLPTQYNLHNLGQTGGRRDADVDGAEALLFYASHPPVHQPVVAVLDTGVELDHPDLAGQLLEGFDFLDDDSDPSDTDGHGTGTASIVGAGLDNAQGIAGLCPDCRIRPVRVASWVVHFGSVELAEGIVYAADPARGAADVVSMSLGGTCSDLWTDAVDYAFEQDVVTVAAAGNYTVTVVYPAAYPRVIAVGATDDRDAVPLWVPRFGTIDVYAPGVDVPVAGRFGSYGTMTGTSAATPHVAATAALLRGQNPSLTVREISQMVRDSADRKGTFLSRFLRLNTHRALRLALSPPASPADPPHESCQIIPLSAPERAAFERLVADDGSEAGRAALEALRRHRIQVGALTLANPELAKRALEAADAAAPVAARRRALLRFLEALSAHANADLRAELEPVVRAHGAP